MYVKTLYVLPICRPPPKVKGGTIAWDFESDGELPECRRGFAVAATVRGWGRGTTTALMSDRGRGRGTTTSVISDRGRGRGTTTGSLLSVCHGWGFAGLGHSWAKVVTQL